MRSKISFLFLMAMVLMGCQSTPKGILSWRFDVKPADAAATEVTNRLEELFKATYQPLGTYTAAYTNGGVSYNSSVEIKRAREDEIRAEVEMATVSLEKALETFDFSPLEQCRVDVTLFINHQPTPIIFDKDYISER